MNTISASEVRNRLSSPQPPLLVHVLPEAHFSARRIEGAVNACSYEMAFVDNVRSLAPDLTAEVILYGEGAPSLDSEDAAGKLSAAGYGNVRDFRGGLREWEIAGYPVAGSAASLVAPAPDGEFRVDPAASVIRWTGRNLFNFHTGTLKLSAGSLQLRRGELAHGSLTIDMNSIVCTDLSDSAMNAMLLRHLKHSDFFSVDQYPTAEFVLSGAQLLEGSSPGVPNYDVSGALTLRGVTKELKFPAVIASSDADHVTAQAEIDLDRTAFGSRYGSGKFFAFLGQHVVNDHVHLHLKIAAVRS